MKRIRCLFAAALILLPLLLSACGTDAPASIFTGDSWCMGFASAEIPLPEGSGQPLYIAGYQNGAEIEGVADLPRASAVYIGAGDGAVLLIGIDCVGLGSGTVGRIRQGLADFTGDTGCISVNVYATHTHAGIDTLGLWGPVAIDGKNDAYTENLIAAAITAAKAAYADRSEGTLHLGSADVGALLYDSREPAEFDPSLHQLRFDPDGEGQNGIRLLFLAAHAESMRGDNRMLSRDFPGALADRIKDASGDDVLFLPGAIGGLIMTRELTEPFDAIKNRDETAAVLAKAALAIRDEAPLSPQLSHARVEMELPLDNTFFFFGKFLGILDNRIRRGASETGYHLYSELGVLKLGEVTLALIPGEIFPELVSGRGLAAGDPEPLASIAARYASDRLLIVGLCNDELGYIVPPSAFLLNKDLPFIETVTDSSGENHYEETNSLGIKTAAIIADAFEAALIKLTGK